MWVKSNTMKLTINHLKGYLDTNLKGVEQNGDIVELIGFKDETYFIKESRNVYAYGDVQDFKPLLHPLSNYIDINSSAMQDLNCDLLDQIEIQELASGRKGYWNLEYRVIELMQNNHIDYQNLIKENLAIEIN